MRPATGKATTTGKDNPPNKKQRLQIAEDMEDSVSEISSCDSNSSWEIDPEQTIMAPPSPGAAEANPEDEYHLPAELEERQQDPEPPADVNSEDEDDHTGLWRDGDLESLILALNHYRKHLKGKFFGSAGGKKRRDTAWDDVVDYVNQRCHVKWTKAQCKGKARRYGQYVKTKYNNLRREIFKTGGGEVDDDAYLTEIEESMLDYIGVEGVVGLPGMHATSLKPGRGRAHRARMNEAATSAWDPKRDERRSYLTLPQEKIKLPKK